MTASAELMARVLLAVSIGLGLAACGLKDDLYLPTPVKQEAPAAPPGDVQDEDEEQDVAGP